MTPFIPQMEPLITDAEIDAVNQYLRSGGWLTEFDQTRRFERRIAEVTGAKHCVAAPNGTLALFLAFAACGVGRGDEVVVPDLTMAATATAAILAGGTVLFGDIEPRTMCLDLGRVADLISHRTKAIAFVSLNGRAPRGLARFVEECRRKGIRVVEDAAQSLGSYIDGRHLGTVGDCGCFSFSSQKLVTTGQGGAVVTDDDHLYETMRLLRDFGRREGGSDRYLRVGWNLKFTDLQAVVGLKQMERLPALVRRKREIFQWYSEEFARIEEVMLPETDLTQVAPWFVDLLVPVGTRDPLAAHLRRAGIGTRPFYPALHAEPAFEAPGVFPTAERVSLSGLWLPSSLHLERAHVARIGAAVREFYGR